MDVPSLWQTKSIILLMLYNWVIGNVAWTLRRSEKKRQIFKAGERGGKLPGACPCKGPAKPGKHVETIICTGPARGVARVRPVRPLPHPQFLVPTNISHRNALWVRQCRTCSSPWPHLCRTLMRCLATPLGPAHMHIYIPFISFYGI